MLVASSKLTDKLSAPNLSEPELAEPIGLRLLAYECFDAELFDKFNTGEECDEDSAEECFSPRRRREIADPLEVMIGEERVSNEA